MTHEEAIKALTDLRDKEVQWEITSARDRGLRPRQLDLDHSAALDLAIAALAEPSDAELIAFGMANATMNPRTLPTIFYKRFYNDVPEHEEEGVPGKYGWVLWRPFENGEFPPQIPLGDSYSPTLTPEARAVLLAAWREHNQRKEKGDG